MKIFTKKRVILALGLILAGAATAAWLHSKKEKPIPDARFRSAVVDSGNITQTVTATGTINPVALINVGSQVSGTVVELKADFNDHVKKGQVLLKLDPAIFNAQIRQVEASVASAQASMRLAQANFDRNGRLVAQNYISTLTLDQSRRELDVAKANIQLAEAQLARSQADLDNSVIRAPIDGVIIKRTIDLGQTVAASFTTPNLFQIARDLTKMQIDTSVSEADVGRPNSAQPGLHLVAPRDVLDFCTDGDIHGSRSMPGVSVLLPATDDNPGCWRWCRLKEIWKGRFPETNLTFPIYVTENGERISADGKVAKVGALTDMEQVYHCESSNQSDCDET